MNSVWHTAEVFKAIANERQKKDKEVERILTFIHTCAKEGMYEVSIDLDRNDFKYVDYIVDYLKYLNFRAKETKGFLCIYWG